MLRQSNHVKKISFGRFIIGSAILFMLLLISAWTWSIWSSILDDNNNSGVGQDQMKYNFGTGCIILLSAVLIMYIIISSIICIVKTFFYFDEYKDKEKRKR